MKCPNCGYDLNQRDRCKAIVSTPWDGADKERQCLFKGVDDGYCKRHSPLTRTIITNRRAEQLREIIVKGSALLKALGKGSP